MSEETEEQGTGSEFQLPGYSSVAEFSNGGIRRILGATRAFQSLPSSGPAWDLQKSYPDFNTAMKNARNKLVPMISSLLKHVNIPTDEFRAVDIDEKFDFLVESNDDMLERIGCSLDEATGLFKKAETIVVNQASASLRPPGTWGKRKAVVEQSGPIPLSHASEESESPMSNRQIKRAIYRKTVKEKPQAKFKTPVDNSPSPFIPKLKEKPNSIKPLSILPEYNTKNEEFYGHPYLVELNRWEPLDWMLTKVVPRQPKDLEETPLVEITTARDVEQLLRDLYPVSELSIDLEHHAYRSFLGFTCLMQISTRDKDYIIDTLALRGHLYHLNEIFTNPKIVKVFHGSQSDVEWLQKDFGLYLVNMFDTQVAAKLLGFQQLGLQALLDRYCEVTQNKTFQLADWRIRPLPKEMIHYARQDTHSLLYVYDMMRNELIDAGNERNNLLLAAYDQSKLLCLKRYEKPGNNPKLALRKMRRSLNNRQVYAFMELYKWRDAVAREKDESIAYVLPNHMLLMISEQLPKEMTGILACCDPVPPLLHSSLGIIHKIVTIGRALQLQEHTNEEKSEKRQKLKDWVILMNSVHDVSLSELTKPDYEKMDVDDEDSLTKTMDGEVHSRAHHDFLTIHVWPQPLREPVEPTPVPISNKPSVIFNRKVKHAKMKSPLSVKSEPYSIDAAATPFDRYELSKEIMDILKDPKKKEALDMANPVVKTVYETVFCDPAEETGPYHDDEKPQKLEKVFTEGEFIPFNPMRDESKQKKRKRKEEWNDSAELNEVSEPSVEDTHFEIATEKDDSTNLGEFMRVPNDSSSKNQKKNKKKKNKGSNILNKLKNPFSKKKGSYDLQEKSDESAIVQVVHKKSPRKDVIDGNSTSKRRKIENNAKSEGTPSNSNANRGRNSRRGQQSPSTTRQQAPSQPSGRGRDNNAKSKRGGRGKFFDFRNRGGGTRSMTFK